MKKTKLLFTSISVLVIYFLSEMNIRESALVVQTTFLRKSTTYLQPQNHLLYGSLRKDKIIFRIFEMKKFHS